MLSIFAPIRLGSEHSRIFFSIIRKGTILCNNLFRFFLSNNLIYSNAKNVTISYVNALCFELLLTMIILNNSIENSCIYIELSAKSTNIKYQCT